MGNHIANAAEMVQPPHPFYPLEANIIGYLANDRSVLGLLGLFALGNAVLLGTTFALVNSYKPSLPLREKATVMWFVLCENKISATLRYFETNFQQVEQYICSSKVPELKCS